MKRIGKYLGGSYINMCRGFIYMLQKKEKKLEEELVGYETPTSLEDLMSQPSNMSNDTISSHTEPLPSNLLSRISPPLVEVQEEPSKGRG
eukprot:9928721-Ditylum_brightwellii.AAC.1